MTLPLRQPHLIHELYALSSKRVSGHRLKSEGTTLGSFTPVSGNRKPGDEASLQCNPQLARSHALAYEGANAAF
jgi:hypothetical protein